MLGRTDATDRVIAIGRIRATYRTFRFIDSIRRNQLRGLLLLPLTIPQSHQKPAMRDRGINIFS